MTLRVLLRELLVERAVGYLEHERAAVRHRVAGVDREVHQDLLNLPRVRLDVGDVVAGAEDDVDVLADQPAQQRLDLAEAGPRIEHPRLEDLAAAEREQLPGQRGGAIRRETDLVEMPGLDAPRRQHLREQLAVALDRRQQVVEVVGDAAGELADGLHLLRLAVLLLEGVLVALQPPLGHGAMNRLAQPGQPIFLEVVRRATMERLDGRLLADAAGHDDERHVEAGVLQRVECADGAERRQDEVREDDVEVGGESRPIFGVGLDALPHGIEAGTLHRVQDELRIVGLVFDQEHPQLLVHPALSPVRFGLRVAGTNCGWSTVGMCHVPIGIRIAMLAG